VFALLVLAVPAAVLGAARAPAGTLSVEGGKGVVVVRGNGGLLGRVARGSVDVADLSPGDAWRPTVNGVTRGRRVVVRGANLSFRILGGDYRLTVKGEGVSISARGTGVATLLGLPGLVGDTGLYAAGPSADCQDSPSECEPLPSVLTRVLFGPTDASAGVHP
jgi:hypothetical protein